MALKAGAMRRGERPAASIWNSEIRHAGEYGIEGTALVVSNVHQRHGG